MSTRTSADVAFLLVGGRSLLGSTSSLSDKMAEDYDDTTPLGVSYPEWSSGGIVRTTLSQDGFYNDATGASHEALIGRGTTAQVVCYGLEGNAAGRRMVGLAGAFGGSYERMLNVGKVHRAKATYTVTGTREDGLIVHALGSRTTAGNTDASSVDGLAGSSSGGAGYLQITGLTLGGYTNVVVKVRSSSDNITFTDLLTFTAATSAPASERKTVAGTVGRYLSVSWAYTGSGTGPSVTMAVGFVRN